MPGVNSVKARRKGESWAGAIADEVKKRIMGEPLSEVSYGGQRGHTGMVDMGLIRRRRGKM